MNGHAKRHFSFFLSSCFSLKTIGVKPLRNCHAHVFGDMLLSDGSGAVPGSMMGASLRGRREWCGYCWVPDSGGSGVARCVLCHMVCAAECPLADGDCVMRELGGSPGCSGVLGGLGPVGAAKGGSVQLLSSYCGGGGFSMAKSGRKRWPSKAKRVRVSSVGGSLSMRLGTIDEHFAYGDAFVSGDSLDASAAASAASAGVAISLASDEVVVSTATLEAVAAALSEVVVECGSA